MSPVIEISGGKIGWYYSDYEHPELVRAALPNALSAAASYLGARTILVAKRNELNQQISGFETDALTVLEKTFPQHIAYRLIKSAVAGEDLIMRVMGVYFGKEKGGERIYYAYASNDKVLIPYIAKGLGTTLRTLHSDRAIIFLEKYLSWLGDSLTLDQPVELVVSYPNKKILLSTTCSKINDDIYLKLMAEELKKKDKSRERTNVFQWLKRAKVLGPTRYGGSIRLQEHAFGQDFDQRAKEWNKDLGDLIFQIKKHSSNKGIDIRTLLNKDQKTTELSSPSIFQLTSLLARLTSPSGLVSQLRQQIIDEQNKFLIQAIERIQSSKTNTV